jgi:glycosyltransferase involved in cell wall biosynthesis
MKSLLYIANLRLPTEKAYGIQIAKMCEAFADSGLKVTLIYPKRNNLNIKGDIFDYYSVKKNFISKLVNAPDFYWSGGLDKIAVAVKSFISARALVREALKENVDVYYTRDELIAYFLSRKNKNVIFECHKFSNKRKLFYSRFKKMNLKIVAISDGLKEDLVKFGIESSQILVARDGVDLDDFNIKISQIDARKRLFSNLHWEAFARKKIAVYVGNLYLWKGVRIFSEVAKYLCEKDVNYLLFIFGGTNKKDIDVLKEELKNIENKFHPNLVPIFYFGKFPYREIPYILKTADCLILTGSERDILSTKYTSPLKMFEYMASGCPIVAQDLPSFREVLNDKNSFLVKPGDAKALSDEIALVFKEENAKMAEEKATKALEDVKDYTWTKRAEKIIGFF